MASEPLQEEKHLQRVTMIFVNFLHLFPVWKRLYYVTIVFFLYFEERKRAVPQKLSSMICHGLRFIGTSSKYICTSFLKKITIRFDKTETFTIF